MRTVTIEINNEQAIRLIEDLEALDLIRVIKNTAEKPGKKKLSEKLAGSTSAKQAAQMRKELAQMRNEWERNI